MDPLLKMFFESRQNSNAMVSRRRKDLKYEDIDQDLVPCNKEQYEAIKNIGVWTLNIIHGPPGTGKSTTIFNGVRYRLPENAKAMVVSQNNQAIGALIEKFKKTYEAMSDLKIIM